MLPDFYYKAAQTLTHIRKKVPNDKDGDAPEVYLNPRDKFRITTFYTIVEKEKEKYTKKYQRFSFLSDVLHNVTSITSSSTEIER